MPTYTVITVIEFNNVEATSAEHARELCEHNLLPAHHDADIITSKAFRQPALPDPATT